jgi:hypothetical protein
MSTTVVYEMTEADLDTLLSAMAPVPYIIIGGHPPPSQQENANAAWASLGRKMGFDPMTVRPIESLGNRFFTATPSETESQRAERMKCEADAAKAERIRALELIIAVSQSELRSLGVEI